MATYNQVSIFGFEEDPRKINMLQDIYIDDIEEDLLCLDFDKTYNLLAMAGLNGIGYVYKLGLRCKDAKVKEEPMELVYLHGHFKAIRQVKFRPGSTWPYLLTGSDDFSVRLWDPLAGTQLLLFLDVLSQNSELLAVDWAPNGQTFLALDVNQNLKIWDIGPPQADFLAKYELFPVEWRR